MGSAFPRISFKRSSSGLPRQPTAHSVRTHHLHQQVSLNMCIIMRCSPTSGSFPLPVAPENVIFPHRLGDHRYCTCTVHTYVHLGHDHLKSALVMNLIDLFDLSSSFVCVPMCSSQVDSFSHLIPYFREGVKKSSYNVIPSEARLFEVAKAHACDRRRRRRWRNCPRKFNFIHSLDFSPSPEFQFAALVRSSISPLRIDRLRSSSTAAASSSSRAAIDQS